MQYFLIVFAAFNVVLGTYIYLLQSDNDALRNENADIRVILEAQKQQFTQEKIEYLEKLEQSKSQAIDKYYLDNTNCNTELESYKALIRAM